MIDLAEAPDLTWNRNLVKLRIAEAVRNLARMPPLTSRDRPARLKTSSLEKNYRPSFDDAFGAAVEEVAEKGRQSAPKVKLGPPDPIAIDRMYEVIDWLYHPEWLNLKERKVCFAKAARKTGLLTYQYGVHRTTINTWHNQALNKLVIQLIAHGVRVRKAEE